MTQEIYYYEDLDIGREFESPYFRVEPLEVDIFNLLTYHADRVNNVGNIHMDSDFAKKIGFKDRVVPGLYTLTFVNKALVTLGLHRGATLLLGFDNVRFKAPVYPNDSLKIKFKVANKLKVDKWLDKGIVVYHVEIVNQDSVVVCSCDVQYQYLMKKQK